MPGQCPRDVFSHQGRRMVFLRAQCFYHFRGGRRIAQAHRQVAQPALVADAPDRRALQALLELGLAPAEELDQARAIKAVAHLEIVLRADPGEAVPRADELAVVAAVDAIADQRPQLLRDCALVLDGEVRDAATRVELVGTADRLRRADLD